MGMMCKINLGGGMTEQTFDSIRWLASEVLLRRGALERLVSDGLGAFMVDCPHDDLTPEQAATALAIMSNEAAAGALLDYWTAYDVARLKEEVPDARATVRSPWLNGK
jgi:hypothetical protein